MTSMNKDADATPVREQPAEPEPDRADDPSQDTALDELLDWLSASQAERTLGHDLFVEVTDSGDLPSFGWNGDDSMRCYERHEVERIATARKRPTSAVGSD